MDAAASIAVPPATDVTPTAIAVLKVGGSVLAGSAGYAAVAASLRQRVSADPHTRLLVVVSAEFGHTDALLAEAAAVAAAAGRSPADPDPALLDLLWSTGETRSVALLALALQAHGVPAIGLSVHETGLAYRRGSDELRLASPRVLEALATAAVVVVPGFLATCDARIVSLGRGGSDWSAVALAIALGAPACEIVKDVDGYFTADPATTAGAVPIPTLSYHQALRMAADGCPVLQGPAIVAAAQARLPLIVRSLHGAGTCVQEL